MGEDNIKINLRVWGCELDWPSWRQNPVVGFCEYGHEPLVSVRRKAVCWSGEQLLTAQENHVQWS